MRAGPLSDNRIIDLLNHYFIPVYTSNEDTGPHGRGSQEEIAEHIRIYREGMNSPCGAGSVYVFILNPQGQVIDGMDVAHATRGDGLAEMLKKTVQRLNARSGPPVVAPRPQSQPPPQEADSLVLHLIARGSRAGFPWRVFPAENWIVLTRTEWLTLLPPLKPRVGSTWTFGEAPTRKLLANFYPQMEELDSRVERGRIEAASIEARAISAEAGTLQAELHGTLVMKRAFYPRADDNNSIKAALLGWVKYDLAHGRVKDLKLATQEATYGGDTPEPFSAVLFSTP